jgi:hypothetical protein
VSAPVIMENMAGFEAPKRPAITPYSSLKIVMLTITDTPFLTKMQKGEKLAKPIAPLITSKCRWAKYLCPVVIR